MRLTTLGFPVLLAAACVTPGERNATGQCPDGEVCSSLTPQGLTFDGTSFSDLVFNGGLQITAVGGKQTITIHNPATSAILSYAFDARTEGRAFAVDEERGGQVVVRATAVGNDLLRIDSAATGELFDRVQINASTLDRIELRPIAFGEVRNTDDFSGIMGTAIWRGVPVDLVVALFHGSVRIVDESLRIVPDSGVQTAWDSARVTAGNTGTLFLDLTFGSGSNQLVAVGVTDQIDGMMPTTRQTSENRTTVLGSSDSLCLTALSQLSEVIGAPWQLSISGPGIQHESLFRNCASFESTALGTLVVRAQIGTFVGTFDIDVVSSAARRAPEALALPSPTPGERAIR